MQVMGYPSLKFFSPSTPAGDMGEERSNRDKSIPAIKHDMVVYLKQLQVMYCTVTCSIYL